jgi:hypothetical protein
MSGGAGRWTAMGMMRWLARAGEEMTNRSLLSKNDRQSQVFNFSLPILSSFREFWDQPKRGWVRSCWAPSVNPRTGKS